MLGGGAPGWTFSWEKGSGPVKTHPPALVFIDGEEEAKRLDRSSGVWGGLDRKGGLGERLA